MDRQQYEKLVQEWKWKRGFAWLWIVSSVAVFLIGTYFNGRDVIVGGWDQVFRYRLEGLTVIFGLSLVYTLPFLYQAVKQRENLFMERPEWK